MKVCSKHNETFVKKCKTCNREYQRKWFAQNKKVQIDRVRKNTNRQKENIKKIISDFLRNNPCIDCGESDPIVLDFDHVDSETKEYTVAQIHGYGMSISRLEKEMSRCVVRCANCHRRRTAKQFNQWRYREFT